MTLKLIGLALQNYARVSTAEIRLDPDASGIVALMGPNESGKTSTLDAFAALVSGRAAPKRSRPVKDGAESATIIGEFVDPDGVTLTVRRTYTAAGKTSIVVHQDGIKVAKADDILRRLYSHIALDPLAFANADSKVQADTLIRLIGVDPAPLDRRYDDAFATRTDVNRDVKRLETEVAAYPAADEALAASELVSVSVLAADVDEIVGRNAERDNLEAYARGALSDIVKIDEQIAQLTRTREAISTDRDEALAKRGRLGDRENPGALRAEIANADIRNEAIRQQQARARKATELAEARDRVTNLEGIMQTARDEKAAQFAEAEWPVPGLSIVDGEVHLDGTPFADTSSGRKLRTSTAIAIRLNPELRAIVIRDGSLLDAVNRKLIDEIAREHDFTVLMELVDETAETGVVFSEGEIADRKGGVS